MTLDCKLCEPGVRVCAHGEKVAAAIVIALGSLLLLRRFSSFGSIRTHLTTTEEEKRLINHIL